MSTTTHLTAEQVREHLDTLSDEQLAAALATVVPTTAQDDDLLTERNIDNAEREAIVAGCASVLIQDESLGAKLESVDPRRPLTDELQSEARVTRAVISLLLEVDRHMSIDVTDANVDALKLLVADEQPYVDHCQRSLDELGPGAPAWAIDNARVDVRAATRRRDLIAGVLARVEEVVA